MRNRQLQKRYTLPEFLNYGRDLNASDPLDRIYALLGMPAFATVKPFSVNYNLSRAEVYRDLAERCILELPGLDILSAVSHIEEIFEGFPSWVPQWDQKGSKNFINICTSFSWKASGETNVSAAIGNPTSILKIDGITFDTVDTYSKIDVSKWFDLANHIMERHPVLECWLSQRVNPTVYPTGEAFMEVYAMVLVVGLSSDHGKTVDERESLLSDFAAYIVQLLKVAKQETHQYPELLEVAGSVMWEVYETMANDTCVHRALFTTKRGYLGLGPELLQPGDVVSVLYGGKVPYILRPKDGHYLLVGDAYVHGIMDGEAVQQCRDGDSSIEEKVFEIH